MSKPLGRCHDCDLPLNHEGPSLREHRHICTDLDCEGDCVCGICGVPFATSDEDDWVLDPSRAEQLRASGAAAVDLGLAADGGVVASDLRDSAEAVATADADTPRKAPVGFPAPASPSPSSLPAPAGLPTPSDPDDLADMVRTSMYADDRQTRHELDEGLTALYQLVRLARLAVEAQQDCPRCSGLAIGDEELRHLRVTRNLTPEQWVELREFAATLRIKHAARAERPTGGTE